MTTLKSCRAPLALTIALTLCTAPTAEAKRRTDCEVARSKTVVETRQVRVFDVRRGSATSTYACRKGSTSKPIFLYDDADGPGGFGNFVVLGRWVTMTSFGCDTTGAGCGSGASLLDVRTRKSLTGPAQPEGAAEGTWEAMRALPSATGELVYSAQTPPFAGIGKPIADGRIAVVYADKRVRELDRGPAVEADTLAVAHRAGRASLFTWRTGGQLRSAEL